MCTHGSQVSNEIRSRVEYRLEPNIHLKFYNLLHRIKLGNINNMVTTVIVGLDNLTDVRKNTLFEFVRFPAI